MAEQEVKKHIKFHTSRPSNEQVPVKSWLKPFFKGIFYLFLVVAVTYVAKFSPPTQKPTRVHGLLSWTFPTAQGISPLWIMPDDGNDSNLVNTGHRIWINPPKSPLQIEKNSARFAGPRMTVFSDSISLNQITELVQSIDSGGYLQVWHSQKNLKPQKWEENTVQVETFNLRDFPNQLNFQISPNINLKLQSQPLNIQVKTQGYELTYIQGDQLPEVHPSSLVFWNQPPREQIQSWMNSHPEITLISQLKGASPSSLRHILIESPNQAVLSREDQKVMEVQKIKLTDWDAKLQ